MRTCRHGPTPKPEPGTSLGAYNVCTIAHCSSVWNGGQLPKRIVINCTIALACVLWLQPSPIWPCGLMGKALALGTKDCRLESCQGQFASQRPNVCCMLLTYHAPLGVQKWTQWGLNPGPSACEWRPTLPAARLLALMQMTSARTRVALAAGDETCPPQI